MDNNLKLLFEVSSNTFLTFKIKDEKIAVNTEIISDIIEVPAIIKIPRSPESLRGVMSFSKTAVPVVDLRIVLGYPKVVINVNSCIIVFKFTFNNSITFIGVLVDSIEEVIEVDINQVCNINFNFEDVILDLPNFKYKLINPHKLISSEDYLLTMDLITKASLNLK